MRKNRWKPVLALSALMMLGTAFPAMADGTWKNGTDGSRYYVAEDGTTLENQWFSTENTRKEPNQKSYTTWYYAGPGGAIYRNGWFQINGYEYYFNNGGGATRDGIVTVEDQKYYITVETGKQHDGWFHVDRVNDKGVPYTTWYYANMDGTLLTDGWKQINGKEYYFYQWANSPKKAWLNLDGKRIYVDEDGARQDSGWFEIFGVYNNGQAYSNWYYADAEGDVLRDGYHEVNGVNYYFDANGLNYRKRWLVDEQKRRYYFDENGILQTGWFDISYTNPNTGAVSVTTYYADETGSVLKDGYHEVDGKTYQFGTNGNVSKSRWVVDKGQGRKYYGEDGAMKAGEWFSISGVTNKNEDYTYWYYADETGRVLRKGWYTIDGKQYFMDGGGRMMTGWVDGNDFYCGEDGVRLTGWQYLPLQSGWLDSDDDELVDYTGKYGDHAWFYFDLDTGRVKHATNTFKEFEIDGATYCMDERGIVQLGWMRKRWKSPAIRGYKYYAETSDGKHAVGQLVNDGWNKMTGPEDECTGDEEWFYFESNGYPKYAPSGTYEIKTIQNKRYLFDSYGNAKAGLREVDGKIYYFGPEDGNLAAYTGTCRIDDGDSASSNGRSEYYFEKTGAGYTGMHNSHYYYQGKLQKADRQSKYEAFDLPNIGIRLLDASGKVVRNRKVKDSGDNEWKVASNGEIVTWGNTSVNEVVEPEPIND